MKLDLDVLVLCDAALEASRAIKVEEDAIQKAFIDAKVELRFVLREIVKAAGSIRGHELCEQKGSGSNYTKSTHRIYVIPGSQASTPYIDADTGEICDCTEPQHLIDIWRALPGIMTQHIAACQEDSEQLGRVSTRLAAVWHGSQALRAFAKSVMPKEWKQALMERTLNDVDLQDALKAAAATGEDNAPLKVIREQAAPENEAADG